MEEFGESTSNRSNSEDTWNNVVIAKCKRNRGPTLADKSTDVPETTDESDLEERLLMVHYKSKKLGAACYTLQTGELQILEEIVDRPPEHLIFESLFNQMEPINVILEGKPQSTFVSAVKRIVFCDDGNENNNCKLTFISAKEYNFEACKRRIYSLSLPHEPPNCTEEERAIFLRSAIDFSQTQTIHALGAMLRYLDLNWSNLCMDIHGKPQYMNLTRISLGDIVTMNEDTYSGLQIFTTVAHPSGYKRGTRGSNKEGSSLFQLFSRCSSKVGHRRMRVLFRHPTTNIATLKRRQEAIAYFMKAQNDPLMRNLCASLRLIKNVNSILSKIKALSAKAHQWKTLYNTLYNVVLICEMCESAVQNLPYLEELANFDTNKLYEMALYMNRIIDFELTTSEGKFTVKAGVDRDLDIKKQTMASLYGLMSETAKIELERLPSFIDECTMLYMPHLGYLLGVKAWKDNLTMEQKELPDMKFMFQNNDYIHYKSKGCEELDVMIGDTYPEILAHEARIMMRLTAIILENLNTLSSAVNLCADLDCLITMSKVCKELNFVKPILTSEKLIDIRQGQHPLFITSCDNFVSNDLRCSREDGYVKILTGPNSSGKSVFMKQMGLIVYLAHIGSYVPAESATIGIISSIYSRIQSTECIAAHMSAFLIDLRQMTLAVRESASNSLIIVDEFGKGTSETDGLALLAACLNTLLFRQDNCPHLLLSTHFLNIKDYIIDTPIVRFLRLEHMVQDGEPVFLFRVAEGCADSSFALQVAEATGIDTRITNRARTVLDAIKNNTLPPPNQKIQAKLKNNLKLIKNYLLAEDI